MGDNKLQGVFLFSFFIILVSTDPDQMSFFVACNLELQVNYSQYYVTYDINGYKWITTQLEHVQNFPFVFTQCF